MASNSADDGKFRQRAHEHSHCSSLSARPNSTGTLSFSLGCLPFTLLLSDRSLLPPLLPSSIAEAGASKPATSYISAQLEHACIVVCLTPTSSNPPPFSIHHPYRLSYPFHVRLHHPYKTTVERAVQRFKKCAQILQLTLWFSV